jgi:hypothetical protein
LRIGLQRRQKLKRDTLIAYGGKCKCCGVIDFEFLTLEHERGDGQQHKKREKTFGNGLYMRLKQQGYPQDLGLAVLCMNCNFAKGKYGYCPHTMKGN